jgi:hypothetical protein
MAMIEMDEDDLRRLYDLATDSPLMCSGSFETDDVRVLRRLGRRIGADLSVATPDEFVRDFPHAFDDGIFRRPMWRNLSIPLLQDRLETSDEVAERVALAHPSAECLAGSYNRRCSRPADHPIHQPGAPEPTSDPDAMIDD